MARYDAGETLASIARTYDCSPPAISYVVSRSRTRQSASPPPPVTPSAGEPHLIKAAVPEGPIGNGNPAGPDTAPFSASPARMTETPAPPDPGGIIAGERRDVNLPRVGNGHAGNGASERNAIFPGLPPRAAPAQQRAAPPPPAAVGVANANGDQRRTLHLSLGQVPVGQVPVGQVPVGQVPVGQVPHGNGGAPPADPQPADRGFAAANPGAPRPPTAAERSYESAGGSGFAEPRPPAYNRPDRAADGNGAHRKDGGGAFIDQELRARVEGDITVFLAAFDAALVQDTQESRSTLREATDRLLRAGARTRIELERLEARIPLPPRDNGGRGEPAWRHR